MLLSEEAYDYWLPINNGTVSTHIILIVSFYDKKLECIVVAQEHIRFSSSELRSYKYFLDKVKEACRKYEDNNRHILDYFVSCMFSKNITNLDIEEFRIADVYNRSTIWME